MWEEETLGKYKTCVLGDAGFVRPLERARRHFPPQEKPDSH